METYIDSASSFQYQQVSDLKTPAPAYDSALRSVRKIPARNVITKKPIHSPQPPAHPKIYKVNPVDFRDVVQRLTGAAEFQPTRLREAAPPPLGLTPPQSGRASGGFPAQDEDCMNQKLLESDLGVNSPLGFGLSPSSLAWCSAMLLSPRAPSSMEPSTAL